MMKRFWMVALGLALLAMNGIAQTNIQMSGNVVRAKSGASDVVGSPYLVEEWLMGVVKFSDGTAPKNSELKFDVLENVLVAKGQNGEETVFTAPVREFTLTDKNSVRVFRNGFSGAANLSEKDFLEVVYDGKTKLVKRQAKTIIESKGYNTATVTKKIEGSSTYYLIQPDGTFLALKNSNKALLAALNKPELTTVVKDSGLDLKKDQDLSKLMTVYESLR